MKIYNLIFLSTIISACFFNETKRCATGLKNESENIYLTKDLLNHTLKWIPIGAIFGGGTMYFALDQKDKDYKVAMIIIPIIYACLAGELAYGGVDIPERVFNRINRQIKKYPYLLSSLQKNDLDILDFIKEYYQSCPIFLKKSYDLLHELLHDFNLYADMMENARILNNLALEQRDEYFALVPTVEAHIEALMKAIAIIKAHPDFYKKIDYSEPVCGCNEPESSEFCKQLCDAYWKHVNLKNEQVSFKTPQSD